MQLLEVGHFFGLGVLLRELNVVLRFGVFLALDRRLRVLLHGIWQAFPLLEHFQLGISLQFAFA